jgi:hypothetical protein
MEAIEEVNADAKDPSTYVNHKAEEFCKAVAGIPTRLGEAILASHKRWGYWRISATARPSRIDASGGPFLRQSMWSILSQRVRRTSGSENI